MTFGGPGRRLRMLHGAQFEHGLAGENDDSETLGLGSETVDIEHDGRLPKAPPVIPWCVVQRPGLNIGTILVTSSKQSTSTGVVEFRSGLWPA